MKVLLLNYFEGMGRKYYGKLTAYVSVLVSVVLSKTVYRDRKT